LLLLPGGIGFQFLNFSVLFQKLVEQHRVYRFVPDGENFALGIACDQIGTDLLHVISYETELRSSLGVDLFLITERDRFQRQNRFAHFVHWLDVVFESLRGNDRAKLAVGPNDDSYP